MIFEAMRGKWPSAQGARCPIERCGRQRLKYPTYSARTFCTSRTLLKEVRSPSKLRAYRGPFNPSIAHCHELTLARFGSTRTEEYPGLWCAG